MFHSLLSEGNEPTINQFFHKYIFESYRREHAHAAAVGEAPLRTYPPENKGDPPTVKFDFNNSSSMYRVDCIYAPLQRIDINKARDFYKNRVYGVQLPDMPKSNQICVMVTPLLRGSTFYIRSHDVTSGKAPWVAHVQVGAAMAKGNRALCSELHQAASDDNDRINDALARRTAWTGPLPMSQVRQRRQDHGLDVHILRSKRGEVHMGAWRS